MHDAVETIIAAPPTAPRQAGQRALRFHPEIREHMEFA